MHIGRLANETLAQIFYDAMSSSKPGRGSVNAHALKPIMLVCRRWKNIAVNTPHLWARREIDVGEALEDNRLTSLVLHRAKYVPLSVVFLDIIWKSEWNRRGIDWPEGCFSFIHSLAPRLRSLRLAFTNVCLDTRTHPTAAALLRTPFPRLTDLQVSLRCGGLWTTSDCDLFVESAPLLRRVTFVGVQVPWEARIFSQLTNIHFMLPDDLVDALHPTMQQFLGLLQSNAAHLQRLALSGDFLFPHVSPLREGTASPVHLPRLQELALTLRYSTNPAFLLNLFDASPALQLCVNFSFGPLYQDILHEYSWDYLQFILPDNERVVFQQLRQIQIEGVDPNSQVRRRELRLYGRRELGSMHRILSESDDCDRILKLECTLLSSPPIHAAIFGLLDVQSIEGTYFRESRIGGLTGISEFIPLFWNLKVLHLEVRMVVPALQKLCGLVSYQRTGHASAMAVSEIHAIPCIHLHTILVDFSLFPWTSEPKRPVRYTVDDGVTLSIDTPLVSSTLKQYLEIRSAANARLNTLEMQLSSRSSERTMREQYIRTLNGEIRHLIDNIVLDLNTS